MPGNIASFDRLDVIRCFLMLNEKCSRGVLKDKLEIGEGSIRSILSQLKENNLIDSSRQGHVHSEKGEKVFKKIQDALFFPIEIKSKQFLTDFFPIFPKDKICACKLYKFDNDKLKIIHLYRDYAIKAGADGALIVQSKKNKLNLPGVKGLDIISKIVDIDSDCLVFFALAENKSIAQKGILNILVHMSDVFKDI